MKLTSLGVASAIAVAVSYPGIASATDTSAVTDLNIRSGPGPQYDIVGTLPAGQSATLNGCNDAASWCQVASGETTGWAYAPYLTVKVDDQAYVVPERPSSVEISTVTYEDTAETAEDQRDGAAAGATIGALAAYAVGGPVGGVVAGGILGAATGSAAVEPTTETITYIESNPVETVYLDGEVAVGAGVPENVTTYEVPQEGYRYLNVNGQTVLVDAETNAIVRVIR